MTASPPAGTVQGPHQAQATARSVTRRLHGAQRAARGQPAEGRASGIYVLVLAAVMGGLSLMSWLASALTGSDLPTAATGTAAALPELATLAALTALWLSARDALVRGPLAVDRPMIDWVLALPVSRRGLLRPLLLRAFAVRGAVGGAAGLAAVATIGSTVHALPSGTAPWALFAPALFSGTLLGVLCTAVGVIVVRYPGSGRVMAWLTPFFLAAVAALLASAFSSWTLPAAAVLASGPWGWAAHGVLASAGTAPVGWGAAIGALAAVTAAAVVASDRILDTVRGSSLRARADMHAGLRSGAWINEAGWLHDTLREGADRSPPPRLRLRPPSHPGALVLWRDATGLLRAPSALARSATALALAVATVAVGATAVPKAQAAAAVVAAVLMFAAARPLLIGADYTAAVPRRALLLPHRPVVAVLLHGCVPLGVLALMAVPLAAVTASLGHSAGLLVAAVLPAVLAGALAGTFRGPVPGHLWIGYETPMGNTAPLQVLGWHLQGPAAVVAAAAPPLSGFLSGAAAVAWAAAATVILVVWARRKGASAGASPS
ncbi:hypothetical protein HNR23_004743 [Nocardiopsis mwathae]|uniref:ABC-2 type transport system permease protein n=1 Tax=Nocardiopsis mwathae TaxID=1472723 RepID=A0A7W9YM42_9ACTN|nr:hypothetical protein [Nocardiopsis mwathae]MBB6174683.1 hypothetical protein [Nocardiopsis mwathae]